MSLFGSKKSSALDVTSGTIYKQLFQLTWPVLLSLFFQQLSGISNSLIIGRFAGKHALGAIQATMPMMDLAIGFSIGIGAGCGVIVGQYFGEHNNKLLAKASHTAMALSVVGGIFMSLVGLICVRPLLGWMGTPTELMDQSMNFGLIYFSALVFSIILNMGSAIMRAVGDAKTPSLIVCLSSLSNIIFALIFVGYFKLETVGCGISTALSLLTGAILTFIALTTAKGAWKIEISKLRIDKKICIIMLKTGIPLGIQSAVYSVSNMIAQSAVNSFGTNAIAAWGLCLRIEGMVWMFADSLAIGVTAFCAQNFGARNYERMRACLRQALIISIVGVGFLSALLFIAAPHVALLFIEDTTVTSLCAYMIRFIIPFMMLYTISDCLSGIIRSTGESLRPMIITIISTCIFRVIWLESIVKIYHVLETIILVYPLSWIFTAVLFIIYYRHGQWLKLAESRKAAQEANLTA